MRYRKTYSESYFFFGGKKTLPSRISKRINSRAVNNIINVVLEGFCGNIKVILSNNNLLFGTRTVTVSYKYRGVGIKLQIDYYDDLSNVTSKDEFSTFFINISSQRASVYVYPTQKIMGTIHSATWNPLYYGRIYIKTERVPVKLKATYSDKNSLLNSLTPSLDRHIYEFVIKHIYIF